MHLEKLSKILKDYKIHKDSNYFLKESDSNVYTINIVFPYGIADGDNYYSFYNYLVLHIFDEFTKIPNVINYNIDKTTTTVCIKTFKIEYINTILAIYFNTLKNIDIKIILSDKKALESCIDDFRNTEKKIVDGYLFKNKDGINLSDIYAKEMSSLKNILENGLEEKFYLNSYKFIEDNALVFIQGKNLKSLAFNVVNNDIKKFNINYPTFDLSTPSISNNEYAYYTIIKGINKNNHYKYIFLYIFLEKLFKNVLLIHDQNNSIMININVISELSDGQNTFNDNMVDILTDSKNDIVISHFLGCKGLFLSYFIYYYDNLKNDTSLFINDLFNEQGLLYSDKELEKIKDSIYKMSFKEFKYILRRVLKDLLKSNKKGK